MGLAAVSVSFALGARGSLPGIAPGTAWVVSAPVRTAHISLGAVGYRVVGTGSPLVLIMGYGEPMEDWDRLLVHALARHNQRRRVRGSRHLSFVSWCCWSRCCSLHPVSLIAVADAQRSLPQGQPPGQLVGDAGLVVLPAVIRVREGRAWLVGWQGNRAVLRQLPVPAPGISLAQHTGGVAWLHRILARLASLGFPSPQPLPSFDGQSWTVADGAVWEMVSFLPGQVVGWASKPAMAEIGALLARYHATARQIKVPGQRPGALPLAEVPQILLSPQLAAAGVAAGRASVIRRLAHQLARDLRDTAVLAGEQIVIHGDFTNHNVLAAGTPPRATGVIDFTLAHAETPLADIGYGLWRSGRPCQDADHLDLSRVQNFVRGYASTARLTPGQTQMIPLYLRGRGLQMIAKRIRAGRPETGMLAQVQWLTANSGAIGDALSAVLP